MKIFIDIGHPAHVHYFKNLIKIMKENGHKFLITARNKEVTHALLEENNLIYKNRYNSKKGFFNKLLYLIWANFFIYNLNRKFKADVFISFASPYLSQVAWLINKPHIALTDTEHAKLGNLAFMPFSKVIFTPYVFKKSIGEKQIYFNSLMEFSYLNKKYFKEEKIDFFTKNKNQYVVLRFVSWEAVHDYGSKGLTTFDKLKLVKSLSKKIKIFISSESKLPPSLSQYHLEISPNHIHSVINNARLVISEGATMASESALLGVPTIYMNKLSLGYIDELVKNKLILKCSNIEQIIDNAMKVLNGKNVKEKWNDKKDLFIKDFIDLTELLIWFIEKYPRSHFKLLNDSKYQDNFKLIKL